MQPPFDELDQREKPKGEGGRSAPDQQEAAPDQASPFPNVVAHGQEQLHQVVEQVSEQRHPRWWVLKRGRLWLVVYVVLLLVVLALALAVHFSPVLPGDLPLTREFQEHTNPVLYAVLFFISFIGFPVQSMVIAVLTVLFLWVVRLRLEAIFLCVSLLVDALDTAIKLIVARQRPSPDVITVVQRLSDYSFPSGHTLHYTVFYGLLVFLLFTNLQVSWGRNLLIGVCAVLIVLVGPSRVYLGEHWPTDVLGAYLIGALCLVPLIGSYLWVKARFEVASQWPWLRHLPKQTTEAEAQLAKEQQ